MILEDMGWSHTKVGQLAITGKTLKPLPNGAARPRH